MPIVAAWAFVLLALCSWSAAADEDGTELKHTNIILIGATGDLAQKYLWRSLFDVFSAEYEKGKNQFTIYGCARRNQDEGRKFMSDILLNVIKCPHTDSDCISLKKAFVSATQYTELKTVEHYIKLARKVNENTQSMYGLQGSPHTYEQGRLVYLSVPPAAYTKTVKLVNEHLRPIIGRPWFRVVIEKPFGQDFASAQDLSGKLSKSLSDTETYRIDHYLGKTLVNYILPFR